MNLRLHRLIPTFALLLAVGCGARSPLDTTNGETTGTAGGNLGSGGTPGGAGGYYNGTGGYYGAGGYYYNTGGYYYNTGGYYYNTGGYYYNTGGYYYNTGGYYYNTGGYYYNTGGYYYNAGGYYYNGTGGFPMAMGGRGTTSGGIMSAGGSVGGAGGAIGRDGGPGGDGGPIPVDGHNLLDLRNDSAGAGTEAGKLDSQFGTDTSTCSGLASNEELIDDLNDGDRFIPSVGGRVGAWSDSHDSSPSSKMYPDPLSGFAPTDTGDVCRKFAAYVAGTGYVIWGADFWFGLGAPYNASKYSGISFWAKVDAGTSPVVRVAFPDKDTQPDANICQANATGTLACYDHYGYRISLTTTWTKYTVPFSLLKQEGWGHAGTAFDATSLYEVLFQIPVNATFGVWIDDVAFTM